MASGSTGVDQNGVLAISRGVAIVLLICYGAYLIFQLVTHKYLYTLEASKLNARGAFETARDGITAPLKGQKVFRVPSILHRNDSDDEVNANGNVNVPDAAGRSDETAISTKEKGEKEKLAVTNKKTDEPMLEVEGDDDEEEEEEEPQLKVIVALLLLVFVTVLTGVTAEFLVSSINGMTEKSHVNKEFVALILLPLVVSVKCNW